MSVSILVLITSMTAKLDCDFVMVLENMLKDKVRHFVDLYCH